MAHSPKAFDVDLRRGHFVEPAAEIAIGTCLEFMFGPAASGFRQFSKGRLRRAGCGFATPSPADTMFSGYEIGKWGQFSVCGIDHGLLLRQIWSISENLIEELRTRSVQ